MIDCSHSLKQADYDDRAALPCCPGCGVPIDLRSEALTRSLESVEFRYLNAIASGTDDPIVVIATDIPDRPGGASVLVFDRETFCGEFLGRNAESRRAAARLREQPEGRALSVVVMDGSGLCVYHLATPE